MPWQQLTVKITPDELARTEALLRLAGASSVAISDADDSPILEPDPETMPLWPHLTVRALFDGDVDLSAVPALLGSDAGSPPAIERFEDDVFERAAEQFVEPLVIGPRLSVLPADRLAEDSKALGLHMGLAFGTGQHPTTRLCLEWLEQTPVDGLRILDFGCGSGILALAALKLGAVAAVAVDNEPQALTATQRNAELNRLESAIETGPPETADCGPFDLIFANILAQPLLELAEQFAGWQVPGDRIALSGILRSQMDGIVAHYSRWYQDFERYELDDWGLIVCRRSNRNEG